MHNVGISSIIPVSQVFFLKKKTSVIAILISLIQNTIRILECLKSDAMVWGWRCGKIHGDTTRVC